MTVEELEKRLKKIDDDLIVTKVKNNFKVVGFVNLENHDVLPGSAIDNRKPDGTIKISLNTEEILAITPDDLKNRIIRISPFFLGGKIDFLTDVFDVIKEFMNGKSEL